MKKIKLALAAFATVLVGLSPMVALASNVQIESQLGVLNATDGQTSYASSTSAKVDDVVNVEVWYHNMENADSGLTANNLTVKVNIPTTPGSTQTISSTVGADNSNTITNTANVNLSLSNAYLQYIPGTATWKHNIGDNTNVNYVTTPISDNLVTSGVNLGTENPCFNFQSTIVFQARVMAPVVSIVKEVKVDGSGASYVTENSATPGQTLDYVLIVKNESNTVLTGVQVADGLPPYLTYVPGSTRLVDSLTGTAGKTLTDERITTGGITIDNLNPGATEYVYLKATIASVVPCGSNHLRNSASVMANGTNQIFNVAFTDVNGATCSSVTPTPSPSVTPPTTLVQTGPESGLAGIAGVGGVGSMGYALRAYLRSKRNLLSALKRK